MKIEMNRRVLYWTIVSVLVLVTFLLGHFYKSGEEPAVEKKVPVEVEVVGTGSIEKTIELTGWIRANKIVDIKSKVAGRIESLKLILDGGGVVDVEEGLAVKRGQQLCVIDQGVYLAQLAAAAADMKAKEVELADAEREKRRIVALYEGGSATEQNKDKAVTTAELAAARLALAGANLELAEINLRESVIVSPIDGIVTAKYIDEGNLIRAGDRIATTVDMKTVKIIVAAAERYAAEIEAGMAARIKVDAFAGKVFDTKVYSIHPALDEQTHTIQVEIRLENERLLLKPGMFARVTLVIKHKDDVVVVPCDVVLGGRISDKRYVYVVNSRSFGLAQDGLCGNDKGKSGNGVPTNVETIAHKRFVEVGITQAERCEITDGLKAGETIVVNGMNYLIDGIGVEVVRIEDIK